MAGITRHPGMSLAASIADRTPERAAVQAERAGAVDEVHGFDPRVQGETGMVVEVEPHGSRSPRRVKRLSPVDSRGKD
jgi:hypothetical protein